MTPNEVKEAAQIIEFLEKEILNIPFHIKKGEHIKIIDDEILFSIVGHNASETELNAYLNWEKTRFYLRTIVSKLKDVFHNWDIDVVEEGLVIVPKKH